MWPIIAAGAAIVGTVVYEKWPMIKVAVLGQKGFSKPPVVNGYKAPSAGSGPPSWTYQGPLVPPAPPTPAVAAAEPIAVTLAPGNAFSKPPKGSSIVWTLPPGAHWSDPKNPALVPTSIGGDITTAGTPTATFVMSGLDGAGTIQFTWVDILGHAQTTLFDVNITGG